MKHILLAIIGLIALSWTARADTCVDCHKKITPNIVTDWTLSKHSKNSVACSVCHGDKHNTAADVPNVQIPTPETRAMCHEEQVGEFKTSKHAAAWAAMKAMPTAQAQPVALMEGMKGCGGCHKIGLKSEAELTPNVGRESVPAHDILQGIRSAFSLRATAPTTRSGCGRGIPI